MLDRRRFLTTLAGGAFTGAPGRARSPRPRLTGNMISSRAA